MPTGDPIDPATLAWFINSLPARTLAIEPGEIEFANDAAQGPASPATLFELNAGLSAVIAERDSLLAELASYKAHNAKLSRMVDYWQEAASNPLAVGCIPAGETVTDQFAQTDWATVFGKDTAELRSDATMLPDCSADKVGPFTALVAERDSLLATVEDLRASHQRVVATCAAAQERVARLMARAEYWKAEALHQREANEALVDAPHSDPHDFGAATETEIPDTIRAGVALTSASHPTGCIAPGETVTWSTASDPTTWATDDLARAIATIDKLTGTREQTAEIRAADIASVDTVFMVDDPALDFTTAQPGASLHDVKAVARALADKTAPAPRDEAARQRARDYCKAHGVGQYAATPVDPRAVALARAFKL